MVMLRTLQSLRWVCIPEWTGVSMKMLCSVSMDGGQIQRSSLPDSKPHSDVISDVILCGPGWGDDGWVQPSLAAWWRQSQRRFIVIHPHTPACLNKVSFLWTLWSSSQIEKTADTQRTTTHRRVCLTGKERFKVPRCDTLRSCIKIRKTHNQWLSGNQFIKLRQVTLR